MQSLDAKADSGSVSADLNVAGLGAFSRFGVEVGSLATFFSSESVHLGSAMRQGFEWSLSQDSRSWRLAARVRFDDGALDVLEEGELRAATGWRRLRVLATSDANLMDAVLRFVVPLEFVEEVCIGDEIVPHRRANQYHQRPAQSVRFRTRGGRLVSFVPTFVGLPRGMVPVVYVRDEGEHWVFHVRVLALEPTTTVLKGCHRLYNRPFPAWVQRAAARVPGLVKRALFIRERVSQRIPFQANGAVGISGGTQFAIKVDWEWT